MFCVQTFIIAALLTELVVGGLSSSGGGSDSFSFDIGTKSGLNKLYNSPVFLAEMVKRPLEKRDHATGVLSHTGVVATLADGSRWLIHKGAGYGLIYQTIVVDARHMSPRWEVIEKKDFYGRKAVVDFVGDGGSDYSLIFNNCHHASGRMMEL